MISIYEAVAPVAQQQQKPVPGVVVPQVQQQTQPAQVPAQQANMANQPAANAGLQQNNIIQTQQSANAVTNQQQNQTTQQTIQQNQVSTQPTTQLEQPETPQWKKYLKYAGIVGGALAGGTLLHDIYHKGGLSNWAHDRFGDLSLNFSNGGNFLGMIGLDNDETETAAVDQSDEDNTKSSTNSHRRTNYSGAVNHLTTQPPMDGPRSSPTDNSWRFNPHRPQPGGMVKIMTPGMRQGYVGRGGNTGLFRFFGSGSGGGLSTFFRHGRSYPNDNDSSRGVLIGSSHGILNPINDYDRGLRHGDTNGA